jgi:ABC-type branched-subunit amino acid transport system permease subunit
MTADARAEIALALAALGFFLVLPAFVETWRLLDVAIYLTYGLFAASLAFVWGHCGLLCLGQAVFFGLGAYAMSFVTLGKMPGFEGFVSSWAGLVAAFGVAAMAGGLLGLFIFRAKGLHGAFFGVVTLAVAVVMEKLFINWSFSGGMNGLINVAGIGALTAARRSRFGLALAATASREARTAALGYDTALLKTLAFALAAGIAGLAGALFVTQFYFASPTLIGFSLSLEALIWVALGGRRSVITGALGAIAFRFAEARLSGEVGETWLLFVGAFFVLVVVLFPDGLFGTVQKWLAHVFARRETA